MNNDLKIIKKKYGENMMHLCRKLFPTILEKEGILSQVILDSFEASHELYDDLISNNLEATFKDYIYERLDYKTDKIVKTNKMPRELLSEAGYDLYECRTEDEIQVFKKYYSQGEELCTFGGGRLEDCYVFFAVKKNIEEIKRTNFHDPDRQDLYGTSVLSIQFTRDDAHHLSIKNRYNHTVCNPDATFSNNLDNIIPGLTYSFEKCYGMVQKYNSNNFEIPDYVCVGEKYYKYNYEIDNVYYCPNNIIIDNYEVKRLDKRKYILLDYYILDLQNKEIKSYQPIDSFPSTIEKITKIEVEKDKEEKRIKIETVDGSVFIGLDKNNNIIYYQNDTVKVISDNFMRYNVTLSNLKLPQAQIIGQSFLYYNIALEVIELPKCREIGGCFLHHNKALESIELPECREIGGSFLEYNTNIKSVYLPRAQIIGKCFLHHNKALEVIELPECLEIRKDFLKNNTSIKSVYLPKAEYLGSCFLHSNETLESIELPECMIIESYFLERNANIKNIYLPKAQTIECCFLTYNEALKVIELPKCLEIKGHFLENNKNIKSVYLPKAEIIGEAFLRNNKALESIELPECREIGSCFLEYNKNIKSIFLPKAERLGFYFLRNNETLEVIELPNARKIHNGFLENNKNIKNIYLPEVLIISSNLETIPQIKSIEKKDINKNKCKTLTFSYTNRTMKFS